ncbi:MAG: STAS domain-containing protein [Burkholderiales bacterium]
MALFSKPPAKKPELAKPVVKPAAGSARPPPSAHDIAQQAQGRRGAAERPRAEPAADISLAGASLIEWSPGRTSIEVAQSNPGLCAVLENAALLYASGQAQPARALLEEGVDSDPDCKSSPLAWLALFDLLQRANDRAGFDRLALQYVVQFERSPPPWEETSGPRPAHAEAKTVTGYVALTGKLSAASAPQIEALRKAMAKSPAQVRLDLAQVAGFDDAGATLLAGALAEARRKRYAIALQKPEKVRAALDILVRRGKAAGEGAWLLSLEFLQCEQKQEAFDDRAIEYAVAFEKSPPSWDPPPVPAVDTPPAEHADAEPAPAPAAPVHAETVEWSGVLLGAATHQMAQFAEFAHAHPVVPIDMTRVERVDFVCAGALLNAINRVEGQRKSVQITGASPIIRALLLLIGISPRHFVKKTP